MDLEKKVLQIVKEFTSQEVKVNSNLTKDLCFDSLDLVELVMALENELDIEIADSEFDNLITVDNVISLVKRLQTK